tara:strand:- start:431 stop:829 length:399 start_codon:yes stop_codon:yes gene_type:complete
MRNFQNVIILSAELSTSTNESNRQRTLNLKGCLEDLNISHGNALGVYKGSKEVSFVCLPKNLEEIEALKDFAFKNFKQESILMQDTNGTCHLIYEDDSSENIGKFRVVSPKLTDVLDSYTVLSGVVYTTEVA